MSDDKIIKKNVPRPFSYLLVWWFIILLLSAPIYTYLKELIANNFVRMAIIPLSPLLIYSFIWWKKKFNFPRAKKNKAGIIVAIKAEKEKEYIMIKNDFVKRLNKLASGHDLLGSVEFVALNNYHSSKAIDLLNAYCKHQDERKKNRKNKYKFVQELRSKVVDRFSRFKKQTKGYFFVWGDIRRRKDLENKYFLSLDAMVTHRPVDFKTSDRIAKEFLKIFPRRISFLEKFEFRGLETSADHIFLIVQFITGMAALISGNPFIALELHKKLRKDLGKFSSLPSNLTYIARKCEELMTEELIQIAKFEYLNNQDKEKAMQFVDKSLAINPSNYDAFIFKSYIGFDKGNGSVDVALEWVEKARQTPEAASDYTWLYNRAFLFMHKEDFFRALKDYKRLPKPSSEYEKRTLEEVVNYIKKFLDEKPDKTQYLFVLGYLYDKKYDNPIVALEYFEKFIKKAKTENKDKYKSLLEVADTYKLDIEKGIGGDKIK